MLRKVGFNDVTFVDDGLQALIMEERNKYDLIILDERMPEMDGSEAAAVIRSREVTLGTRTPILGLQVSSDLQKSCSMDGYIPIPVTLAHLKDTIEKFLK